MITQEAQLASAKKRLSDAAARLLAGDRSAIKEADEAMAETKRLLQETQALPGKQQTGPRDWNSFCPECGGPCLRIHARGDGGVNLACMGGCAPGDVLYAVGLGMNAVAAPEGRGK